MKGPVKIAYIDVLQCLLVVFFVVIIFSVVDENKSKGNVIDPSQIIAEMTWGDGSPSDVDLWMENPAGDIVYFNAREFGGMTLDTDNLGFNNYVKDTSGEIIKNDKRREVISIRTPIAGTYTINVMLYGKRTGWAEKIKVHAFKINPYKEIVDKEVEINNSMEEATIVQFELDEKGDIVSVTTNPEPVSLFGKLKP